MDFDVARKNLAEYIDHTVLRADAVDTDVTKLCEEALLHGFAAVCINPVFVPLAVSKLIGSKVEVCTVIGFPLGANDSKTKALEANLAVEQGAGEIDMVLPLGALKKGKSNLVFSDIAAVVRTSQRINPEVIIKVIIETCFLTDDEKVLACKIAMAAGADFVKTSTGFGTGGAVLSDVILMKNTVGQDMGIKASGGIRTAADAIEFIKAGAARIGTSSGVSIMQEAREL